MSKNNCKSVSDEDLKVFFGRVLTLLGEMHKIQHQILDGFFRETKEDDGQEDATSQHDGQSEQWEDG